jgi:hypothetical protein
MATLASFARNQQLLQDALQRAAREERGEIPRTPQTPAERRESANDIRVSERRVLRVIESINFDTRRVRGINIGRY